MSIIASFPADARGCLSFHHRQPLRRHCFHTPSDTPPHRMRGVLPSTSPLAPRPFGSRSRGSLSRSVFRRGGGSRVPHGTGLSLCQDIASRILVAIEHQPTVGADVCAYTQTFLDECATRRAVLGSPLWRYSNHRNVVHHTVGFDKRLRNWPQPAS